MRIDKIKFKKLPFTIPGIAIFIAALVILIHSLSARNAYEIVLSIAILIIWTALYLAGIWAARRFAALEPVWEIPRPLAAMSCTNDSAGTWRITKPEGKTPWFFRFHFLVRGRFFPEGSGSGCLVFGETSIPGRNNKEKIVHLDIGFPLGGFFQGETSCRLRDIFGFFSFSCGNKQKRSINILSAPCGARILHINSQSGAEDRRNKNASDQERYYMREYVPGDLFRDINWKSSERIDTLITRISPDTQEKITRIEIYFRNYSQFSANTDIAELWLLDRAKARLAWFLRKAKEIKASYVFTVHTCRKSWDLNTQEEIDDFLEELAVISFDQAQNSEILLPQSGGDLYVFSTACDTALPAFLLAQQSRPVSLFFIQGEAKKECERLFLRDFISGGSLPLPRWLLQRRKTQLQVTNSRIMIDYAETRL